MRVDIFKSKFNETDFDPTPENDVTAIEDFEDAINGYLRDLEREGVEIIKTKFKFFDDGRAIAIVVSD